MEKQGRVLRSYSGFYYVASGEDIYTCKVKGQMKKRRFSLFTGDIVSFEVEEKEGLKGMINKIMPRKNYLMRPTVANLDLIVFTMAVKSPDFSYLILDKLLVQAEQAELPAIIVLTKTDLAEKSEVEAIKKHYEAIGYEVYPVASEKGTGIKELAARLDGLVTAFGGPSGVGKSTALNAIQPGVMRTTGHVSKKIGRGRHTTRYTELVAFNGGYLADTPGFGNVEMIDIDPVKLPHYFREFAAYTGGCKFHPCSHTHEPVCGVKEAVEKGEISRERYNSYKEILEEIETERERNKVF